MSNVAGTDVNISEESTRREDIRTINFGLQYMYAFNYTRFSMKAPFIFNEVQRKSAGSTIIGASFSMFVMNADSSIVPPEVVSSFDANLQLCDLNFLSDSYFSRIGKKLSVEIGHGKVSFFVGYRFGRK